MVGPLQFEILADRVRTEYDIAVRFEPTELLTARWLRALDATILKRFGDANRVNMAEDHDGEPVFLARNAWHLERAAKDWPDITFLETREQTH